MLSVLDATNIVRKVYPDGIIQKVISYKNLYLFMIFNNRPFEEEMDPFYSVNKNTGVFNEFSILTDGDTDEILYLFEQAKKVMRR